MTLGGLALAVGILVDDATVTIENIHRNLAMGKSLVDGILDGADQIATPAFVATLSICIVFVPIFLLGGVAYYLFSPLAMAVVFAMLASYLLSRTVVPRMVNFLLKDEHHTENPQEGKVSGRNWFARFHEGFNHRFDQARNFYISRLDWALRHARLVVAVSLGIVVLSLVILVPFLGEDFFPFVDAGQFRLHVQVVGSDAEKNYQIAQQLRQQIALIPGAVDVNVPQIVNNPSLLVDIDRTRADQPNLKEKQIADDLLVSLSGSGQTAPNFLLNPQNGVSYSIAVQTPQYVIDSAADIYRTPIGVTNGAQPQLLSNVASIHNTATPVVVSHYNVQRIFDVYANTQNRDLGGVAQQVQKIVDQMKPQLPRGTTLTVRGQIQSMNSSYFGLAVGIAFALLLVYFLLVVNFQSWLDPFIIITALPGALTVIVWMIVLTGTTISVPALMV